MTPSPRASSAGAKLRGLSEHTAKTSPPFVRKPAAAAAVLGAVERHEDGRTELLAAHRVGARRLVDEDAQFMRAGHGVELRPRPVPDRLRVVVETTPGTSWTYTTIRYDEGTAQPAVPGVVVGSRITLPADGGNVLRPQTTVKLSLRLPPTCNADRAAAALKTLLEKDPPYGAKVTYTVEAPGNGWAAPATAPWLLDSADRASKAYFGKPAMYQGIGGSIPFMSMLGERFPGGTYLNFGGFTEDGQAVLPETYGANFDRLRELVDEGYRSTVTALVPPGRRPWPRWRYQQQRSQARRRRRTPVP